MGPRLRKAMLTVHVGVSVGWLGAVAAYIALNVPALTSQDEHVVRSAYLMMEPVASYAIVPLAVASSLTGILQALGTPWGLFQHYWVLISLAMTLFATTILLLHMPTIQEMADLARSRSENIQQLSGDLFHSIGGLVILLIPLVLNIYKPRGLTKYGWRAQQRRRTAG